MGEVTFLMDIFDTNGVSLFGSDLGYDNSKKNGVLFDIVDIGIESCFCTILFNFILRALHLICSMRLAG